MSVATYAVALLVTFLITHLGIGTLSVAQWSVLTGMCLLGICLFYILFYTNLNLRFREPSLTREQIIYSFFYAILVMHWLPDARPIVLLFFLPPFSFGMLSLTRRQYLNVVASVLFLYAALLNYEYSINPKNFNVRYQIFLFVIYGVLLAWFAIFGGFISNLRQQLKIKKDDMKKANEEIKVEIEERKRLEEYLKEIANTDFLTGVMNRRYFFKRANVEILRHQRLNHPMALLMLDIDHFKLVNDTYGHPAGDMVIRSVANILVEELRKEDLICRFGGEEFAILLVETDKKNAIETANRLLMMIKNAQHIYEEQCFTITVSIGLTKALLANKEENIQSLIIRSDKALYDAKERGRNRVEVM